MEYKSVTAYVLSNRRFQKKHINEAKKTNIKYNLIKCKNDNKSLLKTGVENAKKCAVFKPHFKYNN